MTPDDRPGRLDRLAGAADRLRRAVLDVGLGSSDEATDPALAAYVAAVRDHAHRITDADVAALRRHGLSEDAIFDLTVAAALGAAQQRLDAGLALLELEGSP